jgi:hypothetical protein
VFRGHRRVAAYTVRLMALLLASGATRSGVGVRCSWWFLGFGAASCSHGLSLRSVRYGCTPHISNAAEQQGMTFCS